MKIIEEEPFIPEKKVLKYHHLESGDEFIMFNDRTLRIKTQTGHVSFEHQVDGTYECSAYEGARWKNQPVKRVDVDIRWCRR